MTKASQSKPINNLGIHTYLAMKRHRAEAIFCYRTCGSYWLVNGHRLTNDEFNSMFPLDMPKNNVKGDRIGGKQQIH